MATNADMLSARKRARQALADKQRKRRERDERMEAAATRFFTASDSLAKARRDAGEAIKALVDEGEARGEIADLLGITARDIRTALDALTDDSDDEQERKRTTVSHESQNGHEHADGSESTT